MTALKSSSDDFYICFISALAFIVFFFYFLIHFGIFLVLSMKSGFQSNAGHCEYNIMRFWILFRFFFLTPLTRFQGVIVGQYLNIARCMWESSLSTRFFDTWEERSSLLLRSGSIILTLHLVSTDSTHWGGDLPC